MVDGHSVDDTLAAPSAAAGGADHRAEPPRQGQCPGLRVRCGDRRHHRHGRRRRLGRSRRDPAFVSDAAGRRGLREGLKVHSRAGAAATSPGCAGLATGCSTRLVNLLCRTRYSDLCYGFNALWRRHVPVLGLDAESAVPADGTRLWGDGFEVETLMNIRVAQAELIVRGGRELRVSADPRGQQPERIPRRLPGPAHHPV